MRENRSSGFPTRSDTNRPEAGWKLEISDLKRRDCTIRVAKTKALINFAVTGKLICAFVSPMQIVGFPMWLLKFLVFME